MQPRDAFGVALRVLGVWFLYVAANRAILLAWELYVSQQHGFADPLPGVESKIIIGYHLFLALILLTGTDKLVGLFYGPADNS